MRAPLALPIALALLPLAVLPAVSAQDAPEDCDVSDVSDVSYVIVHANGSEEHVTSLAGVVEEDDVIHVTLTVSADCEGVVMDLATYTVVEENHFSLFHAATEPVPEGGGELSFGPALVPRCAFQVNLFLGIGPTLGRVDTTDGGEGGCEGQDLRCVLVDAKATADGTVTLSWTAHDVPDAYEIHRAEAGGDLELVDTLGAGATGYVDENTTAGETYTYMVVPTRRGADPLGSCGTVEITAVPELPGPAIAAMALVGGVVAYAAIRRR